MADDEDIILSELNDEELVQQMMDDLYDGLKEEVEAAIASAQRHWVKHMAKKLEEEQDVKEFKDNMTMFDFNQARVEEESTRKIESGKYASQTGRTCHTILRR